MPQYHIWTIGCQMNEADSEHLAVQLEALGFTEARSPKEADLVVVNSCVVRQSAEDRATRKLENLKTLKRRRPGTVLALMGCMVAPGRQVRELRERYPYVDVFAAPQHEEPILEAAARFAPVPEMDVACVPGLPAESGPAAYVNVIYGCDEFCTFCIVPYRRGRERSRPIAEIVAEVETRVARGAREVTLLGQIVDAYGHDLADRPDLTDLLEAVHEVPGLQRLRFLTSHPKYLSDRLLGAVARLDRVCEFINVAIQAGDDEVLRAMHRPYTADDCRALVQRIRERVPNVSITTDIIVGFCGETEAQFQRTLELLEELRFDKVHIALYSTRQGTIASRALADDVPPEVKEARRQELEALQERIAGEINAKLLGQTVEVLVEGQKGGHWFGRTRTNKLVFFPQLPIGSPVRPGDLVEVRVERASPWSLQGLVQSPSATNGTLRRMIPLRLVESRSSLS